MKIITSMVILILTSNYIFAHKCDNLIFYKKHQYNCDTLSLWNTKKNRVNKIEKIIYTPLIGNFPKDHICSKPSFYKNNSYNCDTLFLPKITKKIKIKKNRVNNIEIIIYTPLKDDFPKSITFKHKKDAVIVFQVLFSSGDSNLDIESLDGSSFMKIVLLNQINPKLIKKIEVIGHTDLEKAKQTSNFDFKNYCFNNNIAKNTNQCLGTVRALKVKLLIDKLNLKISTPTISYDNDFFMKNTDTKLDGKLIKAINVQKRIKKIQENFNIPDNYNIYDIRTNKIIQKYIFEHRHYYRQKFLPFRSVIVILKNNYE